MSIQTKVESTWRTVTQPWVKVADTYRPALKVYVKEAGTWREAWPLQPGLPRNPVTSTVYRNDRIEIDVDWDIPLTGEATTKYIVDVKIGDSPYHSISWSTQVVVNAPTTALTLTNTPYNNFHTLAGKQVFVSVMAQSAAGRNSDWAVAYGVPMSQLPAPPQPTSYTVTMWQCALHHTWAHAGGQRISGVEMHIYHGSAGGAATYNASTFAADYQSWNTTSIGGGTVTCYLRTTGPGGVSPWVSVQGEMPNPISWWDYRFYNGQLRVSTSGISPATQIHWIVEGGGWNYYGDAGAGAGSITLSGSEGWPRDERAYLLLLRPVNNSNGWYGRDQTMGWARKMPNPYYISPGGTATRRNNAQRPEENVEHQGATSSGMNTAYAYFDTMWYDRLSTARVGYHLRVGSAQIALQRANTGGLGQAISPRIIVHRALHGYGDHSFGGMQDSNALVRGQAAWCWVDPGWVEWHLMEGTEGYKGLGLHHGNGALIASAGYVSAEYMIMVACEYGSLDGYRLWTVRVWHDG